MGINIISSGSEEPVISRLDRLDNMLRQLEEMKGWNNNSNRSGSGRSSCASTPRSTGTTEGEGEGLQFSSPTSLEKHCRPIDHVVLETQLKGSLIQRLDQAEDRLLKLCLQLEEELEAERKRETLLDIDELNVDKNSKPHKKGIKQLVKQCVQGKHHSNSKNKSTKAKDRLT